jgi:hypothetical protein
MTQCSAQNAVETSCNLWASIGCFIYDYQTLIAGLLAIAAALYAGAPVWRQLKDSNLQTRILHRETLASLLREAEERYARVAKALDGPFSDLDMLTSGQDGEPIEIGEHDAFGMEQKIRGCLDWYLITLKGKESELIEKAKSDFAAAFDQLTETLNDVHWPAHNDQSGEDYAIPQDEWEAILQKSTDAKTLASSRVHEARTAFRALKTAQGQWIESLRSQIARLDLGIADHQ